MPQEFTPEQNQAAARIRDVLRQGTPDISAADDPLFRLFAAAVVNQTLTYAAAAYQACAEMPEAGLPVPNLISISDEHDQPDADAARAFASDVLNDYGADRPGAARAEAAAWFRARVRVIPVLVGLAGNVGWDRQCWQIAAYSHDALVAEGALPEATSICTAGLVAAERCADLQATALMHLASGGVAKMTGRYLDALRHYDQAMPLFQDLDNVWGQAKTALGRGAVHIVRRELQEAQTCQQTVLDMPDAPPVLTALATGNLGRIALETGDVFEAIRRGTAALEIIDVSGISAIRQVMEVNHDLAEAHLCVGDLHSAREHLAAALSAVDASAQNMTFASVHVAVYMTAGRLALAEEKPEGALREFTRALEVRSSSTFHLADLLEGIGQAILAGGHRAAALAVLHAALTQRRADGIAFRTAGTLARLTAVYRDHDPHKAAELRAEALTQLETLGDLPASRLRTTLTTA